MQTFCCLLESTASGSPALSFIFAVDEAQARELALIQLAKATPPASVELYDGGSLVFAERRSRDEACPSEPSSPPAAGRLAERKPGNPAPDEIGKFINTQKIGRYGFRLTEEADPSHGEVLTALLLREVDRFAAYAEKLKIARALVAASTQRVELQRRRVERLREQGEDADLAGQLLANFERIQAMFRGLARRIERQLAQAEP